MKKKKVEVKTDPSYRWRMDKQPEASIYIIYFLFIALFDTPRSSFCLVLGGIFWNFVKKKKKTKKTWRETRKKRRKTFRPPSSILLLAYILTYSFFLCVFHLFSRFNSSTNLNFWDCPSSHEFTVLWSGTFPFRTIGILQPLDTHTHTHRESGGKQQQLSKFVVASKKPNLFSLCVGEQEWERESEMMDEESGRGYATRILPIYNHRRRCHRDTHIHTLKSMDGQGW